MNFYRLIYPDEENDILILNDYELYGFKYTDLLVGKIIDKWNKNIQLFYDQEGKLEDYISNPLGWPIVSQRIVKIFDSLEIVNIQYFPANILHKTSNKEIHSYHIVNVLELISALDLEKSVYDSWDDSRKRVRGLREPVIQNNKIAPEIDIFRLTEYPFWLLISERLKQIFIKERITGVDFWQVKTSQ